MWREPLPPAGGRTAPSRGPRRLSTRAAARLRARRGGSSALVVVEAEILLEDQEQRVVRIAIVHPQRNQIALIYGVRACVIQCLHVLLLHYRSGVFLQ